MLAVAASLFALAAAAFDATLAPDGTVRFGESVLRPVAYRKGWRTADVKGGHELSAPGTARFRFEGDGSRLMDASVSLLQLPDGKVRIDYSCTAANDIELESLGAYMALPAAEMEGRPWRTESRRGVFEHPKGEGIQVSRGKFASLGFPLPRRGPAIRFDTDDGIDYLVQDNRKWAKDYTVRFGALSRRAMKKGENFSFSLTVSADVPLSAADRHPLVIAAGKNWMPLDCRRDIEAGSALDFSQMGFTDAPAGKHGWLVNAGGHFEFENLRGAPQKFYGVNLCGTANFPDHALADALVTRFKRLGYNAIRIHHHDNGTVQGSADGLALNEKNMERLDYFLASAIKEGLYITTDIYVSRGRSIKFRHIGIDRDGVLDIQHFKALCAVYDPAFENWAAYAKNFLLHKNRYTGRRYIDEPAMPLISLVNEGGFFMGWDRGVRDDPRVVASWAKWLAAKRAADPSFAPAAREDALPRNFWDKSNHAVAEWTGELEARMVARMKEYLRGLGCKALITNGNCGPHYAALQLATGDYDYIDDHFYVDHPSFLERPWQLPSKCPNANPLLGTGSITPSRQAFTRMFGKPFTITEWNFSGPGRYRGVGGILTGAMAALQGWDGLWRFAYSHSSDNLGDADPRSPGYFDLSSDPLAQASERACLCLFLRGDIEPLKDGAALLFTKDSVKSKTVLHAAPPWSDAAWRMRVGSCLAPESAEGLRVIRREEADGASAAEGISAAKTPPPALRIDRDRGAFTIDTPRTSGGFVPEGLINAGALAAEVSGAPATVWVHSLDGEEIPRSRRLLLTHLTDVQGDGTKFMDDSMTVLLKWGGRPLVRNGSADISLKLEEPAQYTVYELAPNGRRVRAVSSSVENGRLRFKASVAGPGGARFLYEITR